MEYNYRLVQREDGSLTTVAVLYRDAAKTIILASTNPDENTGPGGTDIDAVRDDLKDMAQALEWPILQLSELPGHHTYVPPEVAEAAEALADLDSSPEGFDDGSAPNTPGDGVEEQPAPASPEPEDDSDDVTEPDPDRLHDDPHEGWDE